MVGTLNPEVLVRDERPADADEISRVTLAAFETLEISNQTEHFVVEALRAAKALTISLVAERDGQVVGHIAFSPVSISDGSDGWYGLGPVSVLPELHRQGIGISLIKEGLARLKTLGARGCCLVGFPDYYRKFGFRHIPGLSVEGVPDHVVLCLPFAEHILQGEVTFHEAFKAQGGEQND